MVVPVAAASNLVRGFYAALGWAMVLGVFVSLGGAAGAYYADTAPGALIVVLAIVVFVLTLPASALLRRRDHAALELQVGRRRQRRTASRRYRGTPTSTRAWLATRTCSIATTPTSFTRVIGTPSTPTTTTSTEQGCRGSRVGAQGGPAGGTDRAETSRRPSRL